jgi:hypothetical protein
MPTPVRPEHGTVLAGVKATPFGWPPASPDTGCGRCLTAPAGEGTKEDHQNKICSTEVSTVSGDCRGARFGLWLSHQLVDVAHRHHPDGYTIRLAAARPVNRT